MRFETSQWLPHPPELVFAFFANPENLPRLMPRWQRARIEEAVFAPPPPRPADSPRCYPGIAAGNGTRLTISLRPFPFSPFRIPWEAQIEDFHWNQSFCDTQLRGPFRHWHHCHTIAPSPTDTSAHPELVEGVSHLGIGTEPLTGTLLKDAVDYELPLGSLSSLANILFVRRVLAATFHHRQRRTLQLLALARRHNR